MSPGLILAQQRLNSSYSVEGFCVGSLPREGKDFLCGV